MNEAFSKPTRSGHGLADLARVTLDGCHQALLEIALRTCAGIPSLCRRFVAEARDLLALAQISGRLEVHWLDLSDGLRAKLTMRVPVPCRPGGTGPLRVAPAALLGLHYPTAALIRPRPRGAAFVCILQPGDVWHPNVQFEADQVLCLGNHLPVGIPIKEIVLMTYGALSLQTVQMNPADAAGVLNLEAAAWWQRETGRMPLTRESFLA